MKVVYPDWSFVVPIANRLILPRFIWVLNNWEYYKETPVYAIDYMGKFLLGDGHHRTSIRYLRKESAKLTILETEGDILSCHEGSFEHATSFECLKNFRPNHLTISDLIHRSSINEDLLRNR